VQNDGFLNIYRMRTKLGEHSVVGTENLAHMVNSANKDKQAIARSAPIEIWITGRASRQTASNFKKSGWRLIENAGSRLDG